MNVLMEMRDLLENNGSVFGKTKSGKPVHQFGAAGWQGDDDWTAQITRMRKRCTWMAR